MRRLFEELWWPASDEGLLPGSRRRTRDLAQAGLRAAALRHFALRDARRRRPELRSGQAERDGTGEQAEIERLLWFG